MLLDCFKNCVELNYDEKRKHLDPGNKTVHCIKSRVRKIRTVVAVRALQCLHSHGSFLPDTVFSRQVHWSVAEVGAAAV